MNTFLEMGIAIGITVIITYIVRLLKQPLIIGYILSGIILGPYFINFLHDSETFQTFSHMGISLLLFIVGIGLNAKMIKETGKSGLITGLGQVFITSIIGFLLLKVLGFNNIESIYVCIALTFSSTIVIMKLISDKGETDSLYSKITMGVLIIQDIIAAIMLMLIGSLGDGGAILGAISISVLKGVLLITTTVIIGIYVLPRFIDNIAKSQEFLSLFSIAWCIIVAGLFSYFGFSMEIGALVAGISLSFSPMRFEISARMRTLRDFFLVIFFIVLGSQMGFINSAHDILITITLSTFVLIGNPLIVIFLMSKLGYDSRSGFMTGLSLAQISEFSIILIALGIKSGHLNGNIQSIVVTTGLITIVGSTYMIMHGDKLYRTFKPYLKKIEKKVDQIKPIKNKGKEAEIILFGCHRMGGDLLKYTNKIKQDLMIIDFNPMTIKNLQQKNYNAIYGDLQDSEFLDELDMSNTKMIVSTVPDFEANALLIKTIKEHKRIDPIIITTSHDISETLSLYEMGSTYVVTPYFLGGHYISKLIQEHGVEKQKFINEAEIHKTSIKEKK